MAQYFGNLVSIPIWCDWKKFINACKSIKYQRFNSYMVRLEAVGTKRALVSSLFQFLYGAIGSRPTAGPKAVTNVSIPIWCDWKFFGRFLGYSKALFQFLYGAIGRTPGKACENQTYVSIPIWCDWKSRCNLCTHYA